MDLSFKYLISVFLSAIITFIMINLLGLFLNISVRKIELERIITMIETSVNYPETVNRLNDRNDLSINEFNVGDKKQYYVELTSNYRIIGNEPKQYKLRGYTKVLKSVEE